ncbi:MAG TPA: helix-turn-helix domain-containing protein [Chthoniobacteraceae bacterium]|jgi:transcriptional regulator with XRE-family HTH domain|nr:helix-turn-helix domain-containing protein [Chthoniobacteraceae bacterium]
MKLNYPKAWFEQRIETEGQVEIGAGIFAAARPVGTAAEPRTNWCAPHLAFGQFVALWRRNKGWNAARLAAAAGIDRQEVLQIEYDPQCEPEPDAVFKLADVFGVSSRALLELAGLVVDRAPRLREEASRFTVRSESMAALSDVERQALEAFVTTLSEGKG